MKVRELIDLLSNYHAESLVLVDGYEGGYDPPGVMEQRVVRSPGAPWYDGEWEADAERGVPAVIVFRTKEAE